MSTTNNAVRVAVVSPLAGAVVGGKALLEVAGGTPHAVTVNQTPVEADFLPVGANGAGGSWRALVPGLSLGDNEIAVRVGDRTETVQVRSYPVQGPIFSGPHLTPWALTTQDCGLGAPVDEYGNAPARITYHYWSVKSGNFADYDPQNPPQADDVATTETDAGATVPYIVRRELGAANRGLYELAVLCDPAQPWTGARPQDGWNGKLWIFFYGGWNQYWSQSELPTDEPQPPMPSLSILRDMGLRRGYMIARTTLAQSNTNSDSVRGAEALLMLKDHITRQYGPIRFTVGSGASGGSIMQQMVANQYPGIFQGIIPLASVHSSWYVPGNLAESMLLEHYFTKVSPDLWKAEADRLAVDGHAREATRHFANQVFGTSAVGRFTGGNDPTNGTGLPAADAYHPERNPGGARGTLQDYQVNYLGRRPESMWTAAERAAGRGFASFPWDNVGIQYGLGALLGGTITPEQFVDLNEKIGGVDIENAIVAERTEADPVALTNLHHAGLVNDYAHMDTVAILDVRPPDVDDLPSHTHFHTWVTRAGLVAAHGQAANHVAWMVPGYSPVGAPPEPAFAAMDQWLTNLEADRADRPPAEKVASNKPATLQDGIFDLDGTQLGDLADYLSQYPPAGCPRTVAAAGDLVCTRVAKPQLKPLDRADYPSVQFTEEQWQRLQATFATGVADWSRTGVGQVASVPWLTYEDGPEGLPLHL